MVMRSAVNRQDVGSNPMPGVLIKSKRNMKRLLTTFILFLFISCHTPNMYDRTCEAIELQTGIYSTCVLSCVSTYQNDSITIPCGSFPITRTIDLTRVN